MLILSEEILWANPRDYLCNYHFGVTAQKMKFSIKDFFIFCAMCIAGSEPPHSQVLQATDFTFYAA